MTDVSELPTTVGTVIRYTAPIFGGHYFAGVMILSPGSDEDHHLVWWTAGHLEERSPEQVAVLLTGLQWSVMSESGGTVFPADAFDQGVDEAFSSMIMRQNSSDVKARNPYRNFEYHLISFY